MKGRQWRPFRAGAALALLLVGLTAARAQDSATGTPPATPSGQAPSAPPGPAPTGPASPPASWMPRGAAELLALDTINARSQKLALRVGQSVPFGSLTITLRACVVRPADQPPDAAAFLDITDAHAEERGFHGWMLQAEPSASMLEHPVYDIRLTGCGA